MLLSRFILVGFVFLHYAQFDVCESAKKSEATGLLSANGRAGRTPGRLRGNERSWNPLTAKNLRCPNNRKKCILKANSRMKLKLERQRKRRNAKCCKKKFNQCKKKRNKRCKKGNDTCTIRFSRRCRKQFSKCKKRKSSNRRPSNCRSSEKNHPNQPNEFPTPSTSSMPKKREKEICTAPNECEEGLCCAQHGNVRICRQLLKVDQICTKVFPKKRSPAMYVRCPCEEGLSCTVSGKGPHHTCQIRKLIT